MLSKRHAEKIVHALSNEEFTITLGLLKQRISDLAMMLKENKTSPQIRAVAQGLLSEFEHGGFHLIAAILDRIEGE